MTLRNYVKRVGPNNHPGISIFFKNNQRQARQTISVEEQNSYSIILSIYFKPKCYHIVTLVSTKFKTYSNW